jgi:hypothetical protein
MTRKFIWALALVPLFALQTSAASACNVVGHTKSGEPLCSTTSDGPGQVYDDGRPIFVPDTPPVVTVPKAVQAMRIAQQKRRLAALKSRGNGDLH